MMVDRYAKTTPAGGRGYARRGVGDPPYDSYHPMKNYYKKEGVGVPKV